jgi:tetratricopeptide (TPR) repeat protein
MSIADAARLRILTCIGLSILVLVSYWAVAGNQFISFDDPLYVTENAQVEKGLGWETVVWAFTTSRASNWHPLTWLSLMLDRELFGRNAGGYHWTSVILHLFSGIFLFLGLTRMTASLWRSGLVAALFLVHPLHVESVAWVAERKDVLSGLFWMLGIWCYARYAEQPGLVRYLWVVVSFVSSLLSKPMAVTFPFVLLLLDGWPLMRTDGGRATWGRLLYEKLPLFLLSAAGSVITFLIQKEYQAIASLSSLPLGDRLANAAVSYAAYIGKTFWPVGLSVFYPYHVFPTFWQWVSSLALIFLITAMSILLLHRRPYLLVGWLWYLGTLVPVIGLVQVGSQAMADRYTYLPLVGVFIMAVWGLKDLLDSCRARKAIWGLVSGGVIVVLVVLTQIQVGHWKDTQTLFGQALRSTERNFMAHHNLAEGMANRGDPAGAEKHFREAIRIRPLFKQAYNGLGHLMMIQGKQEEASRLLEKSIEIDPTYTPAMKNLGDVRMRQGRIEDAITLYRKALPQGEEYPELLNNYGVALFFKGEKAEAALQIRAALRLKRIMPRHWTICERFL